METLMNSMILRELNAMTWLGIGYVDVNGKDED